MSIIVLFTLNLIGEFSNKRGTFKFSGVGGGGGETRSGTEKRCSHNLQSGHSAWWSADNYRKFLDFLEARSEPAEEIRNA